MEEKIRNAIRKALAEGKKNFVIFPFGEQGKLFKNILNKEFGIKEAFIIDNGQTYKDNDIKCFDEIRNFDFSEYSVFLVSDNMQIYFELRSKILKYVPKEKIMDVVTNNWGVIDIENDVLTKSAVKVFFNPSLRLHGENTVKALGNNTGNLVYIEALKQQLNYDIEVQLTREWTKDRLGKGNIISILPASNFMSFHEKWVEGYVPILEETEMKFTLIGLGAQASFDETPKDVVAKLTEKQKLYFKLISEHAVSIGVRGEFTAECLREIGITNVDVIGCPSFFQYQGKYPALASPVLDKVLYTADRSKKQIFTLAKQAKANLICQTYEDSESKQTIFFDFKEWNDYITDSEFTFAFGSRFHGNMMALRNKVPTLWIVHDWRTLELVQYMVLPYLSYYDDKFRRIKYVDELLEYCDYSEVYNRYPKLSKAYQEFIRKNFDDRLD